MNPYLYQKFSKQLTRWLKKDKLDSCIKSFKQYGEKEGKYYIIKSNRKIKKPLYAIFIKVDNKLRRQTDRELLGKVSFADLALVNLGKKREGISILKTIYSTLKT